MKNERIITHFQSYTTVEGCVKDLTSTFSGRITVASQNGGENNRRDAQDNGQNGGAGRAAEGSDLLDDMTEMGGIALGAFAQIFPGFGPVFTGGPVVGARVGDALGDYLEARTHQQGDDQEQPQQNQNLSRDDLGVDPLYLVAVEVNSEGEARQAIDIMQRHGGLVTRSSGEEAVGLSQSPAQQGQQGQVRAQASAPDMGNACNTQGQAGVAQVNVEGVEEGHMQGMTQEQRTVPRDEGDTLDPVAPISPAAFIDPNIGYGDYNLVDPDAFATNDINIANAANAANRSANPNDGVEGAR